MNTISGGKKAGELKEAPEKNLQLNFKNKYAICIEWFHSVIQRKKLLIHTVIWMNHKVCWLKKSRSKTNIYVWYYLYKIIEMENQCIMTEGGSVVAWGVEQRTAKDMRELTGVMDGFFKLILFSSVQSLSCVWLFVTPWTAARQASLSITSSWSLRKLTSIESVMTSNLLIL